MSMLVAAGNAEGRVAVVFCPPHPIFDREDNVMSRQRKARGGGKGRGKASASPPPSVATETETESVSGDRATIRAIGKKAFDALHARVRSSQHVIQEERSSMGGLIKAAIAEQHLDGVAYAIYRRLDKIEPVKRSTIWFHLHVYAERAGWDAQADLFDEELAEPEPLPFDPQPARAGISGADLDAHMAKADSADVRPRFLQTGSAFPTSEDEGGVAPEPNTEKELTPF
jgi:hypothetical protein